MVDLEKSSKNCFAKFVELHKIEIPTVKDLQKVIIVENIEDVEILKPLDKQLTVQTKMNLTHINLL